MASRPRPRQLDPYVPYLRERWNAGEHHARALWRESRTQGDSAGDEPVRRVVNAWRTDPHCPGRQPTTAALPAKAEVTSYSAHKTRWLLGKPTSDLTGTEASDVAALKGLCPPIADAQELLATFRAIVTERPLDQLDPWRQQGERSGISEVVGFAQGWRRDYAAVKAALRYAWSQGPVEGHVNRLTTIKRQMYGRAGFTLLRRRVLTQNAPAP